MSHFKRKIRNDAEKDLENEKPLLSQMLYGFSDDCGNVASALDSYMSFDEAQSEKSEYKYQDWKSIANNTGDIDYNSMATLFANITANTHQRIPFHKTLIGPAMEVNLMMNKAYRAIEEISYKCDEWDPKSK